MGGKATPLAPSESREVKPRPALAPRGGRERPGGEEVNCVGPGVCCACRYAELLGNVRVKGEKRGSQWLSHTVAA